MALVGPTGYPGLTGLTLAPQGTVAVDAGAGTQLAFRAPVPNPSHGQSVMFRFTTPVEGDVRLALYDVAGRQVWEKTLTGLSPGDHSLTWDGRNGSGAVAGAGIYLAKLTSPAGSRSVRVVRLD
jgi:flagellar hook assembly protein FlgD